MWLVKFEEKRERVEFIISDDIASWISSRKWNRYLGITLANIEKLFYHLIYASMHNQDIYCPSYSQKYWVKDTNFRYEPTKILPKTPRR